MRYLVLKGIESEQVDCEGFRIGTEDGNWVELYYRRSDGEISLSSRDTLVIRPRAANCARVSSE